MDSLSDISVEGIERHRVYNLEEYTRRRLNPFWYDFLVVAGEIGLEEALRLTREQWFAIRSRFNEWGRIERFWFDRRRTLLGYHKGSEPVTWFFREEDGSPLTHDDVLVAIHTALKLFPKDP